jgi:hypothetical protein
VTGNIACLIIPALRVQTKGRAVLQIPHRRARFAAAHNLIALSDFWRSRLALQSATAQCPYALSPQSDAAHAAVQHKNTLYSPPFLLNTAMQ